MAFIGMRHVVGAVFDEHTPGSEPTYETGSGFDVGGAISGNLTINRNTNDLYYDDHLGESDNGVASMELELGLDDLLEEVQASMGLIKAVTTGTGTSAVTTYYDTSASSKAIGIGYMRVRRKNGATKYQAIWYYKATFSQNSENSQTKGETLEWQTPTVIGKCAGLDVDSSGDYYFRKKQIFDTAEAAAAWLDTQAGITRT